jgi:hypothetical protein
MKNGQNKPQITLKIIKEDVGFSAVGQWENRGLNTCADTWPELEEMIVDMVNLSFEDLDWKFRIDEIDFEYDLESFLNYYRIIGSDEFANMLNIDKSTIDSYKSGKEKPTPDEARKIIDAARQAGRELADIPEF